MKFLKYQLLALLFSLSICTVLFAQAPTPTLTPEQKLQQEIATKEKLLAHLPPDTVKLLDVPYVDGAKPGTLHGSDQLLDLFVPAGPGPFPLLISIHGGGWHAGDKDIGGVGLALKVLPKGFAVASLDYRFVQDAPFPAQIEDCNAALIWLRKHATENHLDPNRVGVIGHSAGAHLTALMAVTGDGNQFSPDPTVSVKVQAAVCWATPCDLDRDRGQWPAGGMLFNSKDPCWGLFPNKVYDTAFAQKMSPTTYVHPGIPPMLIVHGGKDNLVPLGQASAFADKLKAAGVDVTFRIDPDHGHDMTTPAAMEEAIAFFQRTLSPK